MLQFITYLIIVIVTHVLLCRAWCPVIYVRRGAFQNTGLWDLS